jgi:hypothetical protein
MSSFVDDITRWRAAAGDRAPAYHRVLEELVALLDDRRVADRFDDAWRHRTFRAFYDRPLLFLASLRREALAEGPAHPLWQAIGAPDASPASVTRRALIESDRTTMWETLATRFVQTNETSRSVAWLWPATILGAPVTLAEIGTAAGLNLVADRLDRPWTLSTGEPLLPHSLPPVVARWGIDARPLEACRDEDALWLRACVWAGERERIDRLEHAIAAFRSDPAVLVAGDVTDAPRGLRTLPVPEGGVVLAFQTVVRDYLEPATRSAYEQGMRQWLADTPRAVWIELEMDPADPDHGVPIVAHVRDRAIVLGRTGYHPSTVAVDDDAVARFAASFA